MTADMPPADSALREELADRFADAGGEDLAMLRLRQDPKTWEYEHLADAALAVFAAHLGQHQAAIQRVKALADDMWEIAQAGESSGDAYEAAARRIRAALGTDR